MNTRLLLLITLFLFTNIQCSFLYYVEEEVEEENSEESTSRIDQERFTQCYERSYIPAKISRSTNLYPVYNGNTENIENETYEIEAIVQSVSYKNVKKEVDGKLKTWKGDEIPAITEKFTIVVDTSQTKDYEFKKITIEVIEAKNHTEWRQIICNSELDEHLIFEIQLALIKCGYKVGKSDVWDDETEEALLNYQIDNLLPYGYLERETLDKLNIDYASYLIID